MMYLLLGWVCGCGIALTIVDIREHRLPNRIVALLGFGALVILTLDGLTTRQLHINGRALLAGVLVAASATAVALRAPRLLGMGDAKLLLALTPVMATSTAAAVLTGLWLSSVVAVLVVLLRRAITAVPISQAIAYGPFLLLGAICAVALTP